MVIKIKLKHDIVWPLLLILLLQYWGVSGEKILALTVIWYIYLSVKNNKIKLMIPKVRGLGFYSLIILISVIVGLIINLPRDIAKDIFYSVPTVLIIAVGYMYNVSEKERSIKKTLYLAGVIMSLLSFSKVLLNVSVLSDLSSIRDIMGGSVYEVSLIAAMMFTEKVVGEKVIFSKKSDWIIFIILLLKCTTSLGRAEMLVTLSMIILALVINIYLKRKQLKTIVRVFKIVLVSVISCVVIWNILPKTARTQFVNKLEYSFEEIDTKSEYDSTADAMQHWRAYEIQCAKNQWQEYNAINALIGEGFGTYIRIEYIPDNFTDDMITYHGIALLHNSYYTFLIKSGILGVTAILWLYLSNILPVFFTRKKEKYNNLAILTVITLGMALYTYFVRGIFSQTMWASWGIMAGWINAEIRKVK